MVKLSSYGITDTHAKLVQGQGRSLGLSERLRVCFTAKKRNECVSFVVTGSAMTDGEGIGVRAGSGDDWSVHV